MRDKLHGFTREANFGLPLQLGGGWCFAALLLGGVVGGAALYLDSIPESAETLKYLNSFMW